MSDQSMNDLVLLRPFLLLRARRFGLSRQQAGDVVRDVLLAALAHGRRLTGEDLKMWCRVAVRNRAINIRRPAWARMTTSPENGEDMRVSRSQQEHIILLPQVGEVVKATPARAQRLMYAIPTNGNSIADTVATEGVMPSTIRSGLHRAQALLRHRLEGRTRQTRTPSR
jgi:DNA-directed RNA polymerase specialized sigma24 family protein